MIGDQLNETLDELADQLAKRSCDKDGDDDLPPPIIRPPHRFQPWLKPMRTPPRLRDRQNPINF